MLEMNTNSRPVPQFLTLPIFVRERLELRGVAMKAGPWVPPTFQGYFGIRSEDGEPTIILASETPLHTSLLNGQLSKEELEAVHFEKFSADHCLSRGFHPFLNIRAGVNPPDFVAEAGGTEIGVDLTQFTAQERRQAHALFAAVRQAISVCPPERFQHLRGLMVFVWAAGRRGVADLPPRSPEADALTDSLASYRFDPEFSSALGIGPMPAMAPPVDIRSADGGWSFIATPFTASCPSTAFFRRFGFELSFHYPTVHTSEGLWAEISRLISKHDKPEVQELVVTVGAPDRSGVLYPGDTAMCDFILSNPKPLTCIARQLRRVLLHVWETGRIVQLFPALTEVAPALVDQYVPAHSPLKQR